jgi:hypothetical protein
MELQNDPNIYSDEQANKNSQRNLRKRINEKKD